MNDITIREYRKEDRESLETFELSVKQQVYSSLPKDVLGDAVNDPDRTACVVENEEGEIVGFFVLHKYYQHEGYDTPHEVVYIRSLSINEKQQGRGYGTKVAMALPQYVQGKYTSLDHLYLVVDAENQGAWNLYERAGFMHTATKEDGPIGKERLYYLDLDQKYVHNVKLELDESVDLPHVRVDIILNKKEKVGYIEGEADKEVLRIIHLYTEAAERNRGIASTALRQLGTFLRRNMPDIRELTVNVDDAAEKIRLFERVGFVKFDEDENARLYKKYINY
ncbi:acetyltransferase [Salinicoccus sediminis]|uniref:Acetyltransferase n=1 Tax=Salinicoccus sediminis TaxID=1432562 RepID=A0A0M2SR83_9STAP|nr:GNAT family N-acetyltransferase [Salinicoccus sediminis]KKK35150.1 acetyltransferase [Salinicoccus sediminis]